MRKKILIVAPYSFGELTDCYYWAKYASGNNIEITYFGYSGSNWNIDNVKLITIPHSQNKFKLLFTFYKELFKEIKGRKHENIIFCYWNLCFLLPIIFPKKNIVLDIRTASVAPSLIKRLAFNLGVRFSSLFFKRVSVISKAIGLILKINPEKLVQLPLGAEILSITNKDFTKEVRLFYIGILDQRKIVNTIIGFKYFVETISPNARYDIIGYGSEKEEKRIIDLIANDNLSKNVFFHGKKSHAEAKYLFDVCNTGVSYIPLKSYFDKQSPTKTYEYILSGLNVIATNTSANCEIINNSNGVLINEGPDAFYRGLVQIYKKKNIYHSESIRNASEKYHWKNIVNERFIPIFF